MFSIIISRHFFSDIHMSSATPIIPKLSQPQHKPIDLAALSIPSGNLTENGL